MDRENLNVLLLLLMGFCGVVIAFRGLLFNSIKTSLFGLILVTLSLIIFTVYIGLLEWIVYFLREKVTTRK